MIRTTFALAGGLQLSKVGRMLVYKRVSSPIAKVSSHRVLSDAFAWLQDPDGGRVANMHEMPHKDVMKPIGCGGRLIARQLTGAFATQTCVWPVAPLGRNAGIGCVR